MPMMTDVSSRPEEVGEILVKVHEDLMHLKERILQQGDLGKVDISSLEAAIQKTEDGLKSKADVVLQQLNNQVQTLPTLDAQQKHSKEPQVAIEKTWDIQAVTKGDFSLRRPQAENRGLVESRDLVPVPDINHRPVPYKKLVEKKVVGKDSQTSGLTPGQNFKYNWYDKVVDNPYNPQNRNVLNQSYGIQLPLIEERQPSKGTGQQLVKGSTVEPLQVLPRANRIDPQLLPPTISETDAKFGILSLIERGLIPPAAQLSLDPSPVRHKAATLHDPKIKEGPKVPPTSVNNDHPYNGIKLDPSVKIEDFVPQPYKPVSPVKLVPSGTGTPDEKSRIGTGGRRQSSKLRTPISVKTLEIQPMPPPTTPASDFKQHRFAIQNGKTLELSPEFIGFKQHYCLSWGSIVTTLKYLEKVLANYSVPIAFINGDKLADLSIEFELEKAPSERDLLTVIVNREDVENLINRPGRRYIGPDGRELAASKVQATWKMYKERMEYLEYRRKKWAAGVIAISWVMNVKMAKVRKQLTATRSDQLENFRRRAKIFSRSWDRIKQSKRVIIHIPSQGFSAQLRSTIGDFSIMQNSQMARLCDIKDPNVDVIYVSPVPVNEEMQQYYTKLLGLKPAIDTGNVDDQGDLNERYKIIVPESIKSFPTHNMSLSALMKYSPRTLKRINNLIRGREAYIVTGKPSKDDLHIADYLDVPLYSPEPEVAQLYSTKSGSKRIFASANVDIPPGEYDIYSLPQLQECLAQLITENLEVTRWLFKIDDEFDGRGIAYLEVSHLKCYPWALKEAQRYGEKWSKKWAQEAAYIKIHAEIPDVLTDHAVPVNTKVYPNWQKFLAAYLAQGGIIEACPPSDSVTALTVDMLIEPNGKISIKCMGDQIHAETPFSCWGMSVPQSSVEPEQLNDCCYRIAEACKHRGIIGYFSLDFVTFIHPKSMSQMLWVVDLDLSYSDSTAMFQLIKFSTGGHLDTKQHYFDIPPPKKEEKKTRRRRAVKEEEETPPNTNRYAVMSTRLRHSNLSVVHYSVFFQMCRAHGIGYDIKEKQGTVFTLVDGYDRARLGMVTIGDNLQGALATFARNLSVIHQEISAPNMQGESNFRPVIEDIESILGTTVQNSEELPEESSTTEADT